MKFIYIVALLFIFITGVNFCAFSQSDNSKISFIAYWSKGEHHKYRVTKVKHQFKDEVISKIDTVQYIADFKVIDSTSSSYKISWTYQNDLTNIFNLPVETIWKFEKYQKTEVIYTTNEMGSLVGIENWEAIRQQLLDMFTELGKYQDLGNKLNHVELEEAMASYSAIYSSKKGIEQLVFKELQYFHFPLGIEFSTIKPAYYEDQLPNMFGGDPIKGNVKIYFEKIDRKKHRCKLIQTMTLNPDGTRNMMKQVFTKMKLNDEEMQEAFKTAKFEISDLNTYDYLYYPGLPLKIETHRETNIDLANEKSKRIDQIIIELIDE